LWRRFDIAPIQAAGIIVVITAIGFVAAIASLQIPQLGLLACALLGIGGMICSLNPYFGTILFLRYPSKMIAPGIIFLAFLGILLHSLFLELFRDYTALLYTVYLVIAVTGALVFLMVRPYLLVSSEGTQAAEVLAERSDFEEPAVAGVYDQLTDRELQIVELLLQGLSAKQIARQLGNTLNTITSRRRDIYAKLQIHSVGELFVLDRQNRDAAAA
jgi:DNA-binding CsgD family transcriptional regulator